jgi:formylglycine-generating enzyme required for sulfatase activity
LSERGLLMNTLNFNPYPSRFAPRRAVNWFLKATVIGIVALLTCTFPGFAQQPKVDGKKLAGGVTVYEKHTKEGKKSWLDRFEEVYNAFSQPPFGKSVAFLVGVGSYQGPFPPLPFVANDINDMRTFLLGDGGFDVVYEVTDGSANRDLVEDYMMNKFRKLSKDDRLLFYYAGHGDEVGGETGYILFSDARKDDFAHEVLPISRVTEWSRVVPAKHILFLFDTCASGLAFSPRDRGPGDKEKAALIATLSGEGSRVVVTAGTGTQKTFEVEDEKHRQNGVFTRAFLDSVESSRNDGLITIDGIFAKLQTLVADYSVRGHLNPETAPTPRISHLGAVKGTFLFISPADRTLTLDPDYATVLKATPRSASLLPPGAVKRRINDIDGLAYVWIREGQATLGCDPGRNVRSGRCLENEMPQHSEVFRVGFYMGETDVTVEAFSKFSARTSHNMPESPFFNPSWRDIAMPMVDVTWNEAQEYCQWAGGGIGRLPTEVEWEYAARGGHDNEIYPWGKTISSQQALFNSKSGPRKADDGTPNGFGLRNIVGNVSHLTADGYRRVYAPFDLVPGYRTIRGGSWADQESSWLRIPSRRSSHESEGDPTIGFRCVVPEFRSVVRN